MNPAAAGAVAASLGVPVRAARAVSGGCISPAYRVELGDGTVLFVKTARPGWPADAFAEEARSLRALREPGAVRVPEVLGVESGWLALEWLEPAPPTTGGWAELGHGLARLHRHAGAVPGWPADNYIGPLPQRNRGGEEWPAFWAECRLRPQAQAAAPRLDARTRRDLHRLEERLPELLAPAAAEGASLLHGDLWSGNVLMSTTGAALVDPASYHGHREVDLAMAALFGGFPSEFERAYAAEWPLLEGFERRRLVYQLYYLLVHVVLFGGSYAASVRQTVTRVLDG